MKKKLIISFIFLLVIILFEVVYYNSLSSRLVDKNSMSLKKQPTGVQSLGLRSGKKTAEGVFQKIDKDNLYINILGKETIYKYKKPKPYIIFIKGDGTIPAKLSDLKKGLNIKVEITKEASLVSVNTIAIIE